MRGMPQLTVTTTTALSSLFVRITRRAAPFTEGLLPVFLARCNSTELSLKTTFFDLLSCLFLVHFPQQCFFRRWRKIPALKDMLEQPSPLIADSREYRRPRWISIITVSAIADLSFHLSFLRNPNILSLTRIDTRGDTARETRHAPPAQL